MGFFSFLQRKKPPAPETRKRTQPPQDPVTIEALRTRARRRLIGAAVLVGGAVVALPTLFDRPPRSAEQAFNVRVAAPDGSAVVSVAGSAPAASAVLPRLAASGAIPAVSGSTIALATAGAAAVGLLPGTSKKPRADETIITESKPDPKAEMAARAEQAAREQVAANKLRVEKAKTEKARIDKLKADKLKAEKARETEQIREAEKEKEKNRIARAARKAKEAKAAEKAAKADKADKTDNAGEKSRRYVIQAGSFSDAAAARDLGRRIGKLGLDSHEQHVETAAGSARTRVRLGPFKSKEEALRAAARLKAAGLNAAVLPL